MEVKCEYCGALIPDNADKCPNCGAVNVNMQRAAEGVPQTIAELEQWYKAHNLPPYEETRFFIGVDCREPKCFGIYQDGAEFIVYKNKSDGSRAVRYRGRDEDYAVNELYLKLKSEIVNQREKKSFSTGPEPARSSSSSAGNRKSSSGGSGKNSRKRKKAGCSVSIFTILFIVIVVLFVACSVKSRLQHSWSSHSSYGTNYSTNNGGNSGSDNDGNGAGYDSTLEQTGHGTYSIWYLPYLFDDGSDWWDSDSDYDYDDYSYDDDYGGYVYDQDSYDTSSIWDIWDSDWDDDFSWDTGSDWDTGWSDWDSDW